MGQGKRTGSEHPYPLSQPSQITKETFSASPARHRRLDLQKGLGVVYRSDRRLHTYSIETVSSRSIPSVGSAPGRVADDHSALFVGVLL